MDKLVLSFVPCTLEFRHPFRISGHSRNYTDIVVTRIFCNGITGFGEASMPPYLGESHETVSRFLTRAVPLIGSYDYPFEIGEIMRKVNLIEDKNTAAKAGIDIALHDLKGKIENRPCFSFWDLKKENTPYTSVTIGMDNPDVILKKLEEAGTFKILKVKLGGDNDFSIINTIRSFTDKPASVDVNQGWNNREEALDRICWLKENNILFVEQPLAKENLEDARWLSERSPLPVIADESFQRFADLEKVKNCFHGINVKLMKCTGLNEAYKIIEASKKLKMKILIGCMSESSCAISAAAQLSPMVDWADLDGPQLIKNDLFSGLSYVDGKLTLNERPGLGVKWIGGPDDF